MPVFSRRCLEPHWVAARPQTEACGNCRGRSGSLSEIMQIVTSAVRVKYLACVQSRGTLHRAVLHPGVPVMWQSHMRDLSPTAEAVRRDPTQIFVDDADHPLFSYFRASPLEPKFSKGVWTCVSSIQPAISGAIKEKE